MNLPIAGLVDKERNNQEKYYEQSIYLKSFYIKPDRSLIIYEF